MGTELERPDDGVIEHLEQCFTAEEEAQLTFLMVKVSNCKNNLSNPSAKDIPTLHLEYQLADIQYKHSWAMIRLRHVSKANLDALEEVGLMHSRLNAIEYHFSKQLKDAVANAMQIYQKEDDFNRMVAVYKNGLKRGAQREKDKDIKND